MKPSPQPLPKENWKLNLAIRQEARRRGFFAELTKDCLGCVGAIRSRNLVDWEDLGPIFKMDKPGWGYTQWEIVGYGIPESPFLLEKDGRWHNGHPFIQPHWEE